MARTFTAVYNPYSFDELVKPLAMYASEYRRQEDLMNKAYEEGIVEGTLAEGTKAYQIWEGINNNLREVADELATNGMNPQLNKRINSVARDYRMKSKTLTQANAAYQQERQRRLNAMDSHVFQNNSSLSIDDFLDGKTPENKGVNLPNLTKDIGTEVAQLSAALYSSPDWNNIKTRLGGQVYAIVTPNGAPMDLIQAAMFSDAAYSEILKSPVSEKFKQNLQKYRDVYANALKRVEYDKYDLTDQRRIDEAIRLGMGMGMQQPKTETVANRNYRPVDQIIKDNLEEAEFRFKYDFTGEYGSKDMRIKGETQDYRDLQTVKSAQSSGLTPEFNEDGTYKKDQNGNIIFKQAYEKTSSTSGKTTKGEDYGVERIMIGYDKDGKIVSTIDKSLGWENLPDIKYEDIPEDIKYELEYKGINAGNADTYAFGIDSDGNIHAMKLKKYTTTTSPSNPLNFGLVTPPVQDTVIISQPGQQYYVNIDTSSQDEDGKEGKKGKGSFEKEGER